MDGDVLNIGHMSSRFQLARLSGRVDNPQDPQDTILVASYQEISVLSSSHNLTLIDRVFISGGELLNLDLYKALAVTVKVPKDDCSISGPREEHGIHLVFR